LFQTTVSSHLYSLTYLDILSIDAEQVDTANDGTDETMAVSDDATPALYEEVDPSEDRSIQVAAELRAMETAMSLTIEPVVDNTEVSLDAAEVRPVILLEAAEPAIDSQALSSVEDIPSIDETAAAEATLDSAMPCVSSGDIYAELSSTSEETSFVHLDNASALNGAYLSTSTFKRQHLHIFIL
jgi:hypothetical protein